MPNTPRSARSDFWWVILAGFVPIVFGLILLEHDPLIFWNDDYELSILPVFADVARSWNEGHLPLLSPYSWVCSNLAGEFQYGTFSVFINAMVVLVWKFPLTFPQQAAALSMAHLFVLSGGSFLLARGRQLSRPLAMLVAVVATLNGWIICWGATDWFGALGALAWLPWCWWALEKSVSCMAALGSQELRPQHFRRVLRAMVWPAPFVYLLVTGGFPYTVVMLGLLVAWLCLREICRTRRWILVTPLLAGAALGFGLSAPAWLALLDYVHGSNRSAQSALAHWQWLVPPAALPGFILPSWTVKWVNFSTRYMPHGATELACGLVPAVALIWGLMLHAPPLVRRIRWELGLLLLVLVLSMFPSAGVFRWSFRWLPFLHLILVLCAGEALRLAEKNRSSFWRMPALWGLGAIGLTTLAGLIAGASGTYGWGLLSCTVLICLAWMAAEISPAGLRAWAPAAVAFGALLSTYLLIPPNCGVPKYNLSQELIKPEPLDQKRLYLAVYSPAEYAYRREYRDGPVGQVARPGSTSLWAGLHFINGYSPILPAGVACEFKFFIHGEIDADVGRYLVAEQAGPRGILEKLGVDGIVIASEVAVEPDPASWRVVFANSEGRVFHRSGGPLPRIRSVDQVDSAPEQRFARAAISGISDERNRMEADVDVPPGGSPARLTFSRPYFRGYQGHLGDQALRIESYRGLFPVVEIPAGAHGHLVLTYRPWWLSLGGAISLCCLLVSLGAGIAGWRRPRRETL